MPSPIADSREIARQAWLHLPPKKRSAENIRKALKAAGIDPVPSKGSVNRWKAEWEEAVDQTASVLLPAVNAATPTDLKDIPDALQDALGLRLLYVSRGEGLDRVEDAIIKLSGAIATKAPQIAEMLLETETETVEIIPGADGEEAARKTTEKAKVARSAVAAIAQLASAMQTITAARTMVSVAHRNFGEGDKASAEAQAILETGRADRAKDVSPTPPANRASAAEEAMAALRDTITSRK